MRTKTIHCKMFSQAHGNGFNIVAIKQPFNPLDNVGKEGEAILSPMLLLFGHQNQFLALNDQKIQVNFISIDNRFIIIKMLVKHCILISTNY